MCVCMYVELEASIVIINRGSGSGGVFLDAEIKLYKKTVFLLSEILL